MSGGWSPPPSQEYDFNDCGEKGGDRGGEGGGSVRWGEESREVVGGQQHQGDCWEKRRREGGSNVGEVRGQLVLAPGGGENSSTLRVRIREEGGGEEGESAHTLSRWKSLQITTLV